MRYVRQISSCVQRGPASCGGKKKSRRTSLRALPFLNGLRKFDTKTLTQSIDQCVVGPKTSDLENYTMRSGVEKHLRTSEIFATDQKFELQASPGKCYANFRRFGTNVYTYRTGASENGASDDDARLPAISELPKK